MHVFLVFPFVFLATTALLQNFWVDSFIFAAGNLSMAVDVDSFSEEKTLIFLSWLGIFYWKIYAWAPGRSWQDWKTEGPDSLAGKDSKSCWPSEGNLMSLLRKFRHQTVYSASLSCKTDLEFEMKFIFSDLTSFVIWQTHKDQIWSTSFFSPFFLTFLFNRNTVKMSHVAQARNIL